jgi:hypothetical protein
MHLIGDGAPTHCANCGATLSGPFCAQCGQHARSSARSLGVLLHDGWHVLTHVDSRLWRTLSALLFRPGRLTLEYFADRRERYIPPLRLYLIISVLFFAIPDAGKSTFVNVRSADNAPAAKVAAEPGEKCDNIHMANAVLRARLYTLCQRTMADRGAAFEHMFRAAVPRVMFAFLPLLAAFMLLLYWHPRRLYVEHLVFFLHTHAASFLLLLALVLLGWLEKVLPIVKIVSDPLVGVMAVYIVVYLYLALRRFYGQSRRRTLLKAFPIAVGYSVCLLLMSMLTLVYTALMV